MLQFGHGDAIRRRKALGTRVSSAIPGRSSSRAMAYLHEIQTGECQHPNGRSELCDVPRRIYVEAAGLKTLNAV